jgi:hypothetical protein
MLNNPVFLKDPSIIHKDASKHKERHRHKRPEIKSYNHSLRDEDQRCFGVCKKEKQRTYAQGKSIRQDFNGFDTSFYK